MTSVAIPETPLPQPPLRILVVDTDRRVRQSLCGLLALADDLAVAGATGDIGEAVELLASGVIDLVVVDPRLPDIDTGLGFVRLVRERWPELPIAALGCAPTDEAVVALTGATGFVARCGSRADVLDEVRSAAGR